MRHTDEPSHDVRQLIKERHYINKTAPNKLHNYKRNVIYTGNNSVFSSRFKSFV